MLLAFVAFVTLVAPRNTRLAGRDTLPCTSLEAAWNLAHVQADTVALDGLWAEDLRVTVPDMPPLTKAALLAFWRSGRSRVTRHETSALTCQDFGDTGVVTGRLLRERDFNGRLLADDWQFTKVYIRRDGRWQVVAYHASPSPR